MAVIKPVVGGSANAWGTILNTALDYLDARIDSGLVTLATLLPFAGGTMTGRLIAKTESLARVTPSTTSGNITFDLNAGNYFTIACTAASSWIFSNVPAGAIATGWIVKVTNPGAFPITFAAGAAIKWPGGVVPTFSVAGKDTLVFITDDDGVTIRASVLAQNQ